MESAEKRNRIVRRAFFAGAVGLALLGIGTLSAQARGPGWGEWEPSAYREAARMAEQLGLTPDQQARVRQIFTETFAKHREIREEAGKKMDALREEGRKKMEALEEETDSRLSAVLTPEQMGRLHQLREEHRDRFRDHRRDRRGDRGPWSGGPEGGFPPDPPGESD